MDNALMSVARWMSCLWPGLPQLWRQGSWVGLAVALGWGLLANWLLAATFVWTEIAPTLVTQAGWAALACGWIAGIVLAVRWYWRLDDATGQERSTDLLREAQIEYLRGNWLVARAKLEEILSANSADVEAQLMIASLYRHTGRKSKAGEHLRWLERLAASRTWEHEIQSEWQLLNEIDDADVVAPDGRESADDTLGPIQNDPESNNNLHSQTPAAA